LRERAAPLQGSSPCKKSPVENVTFFARPRYGRGEGKAASRHIGFEVQMYDGEQRVNNFIVRMRGSFSLFSFYSEREVVTDLIQSALIQSALIIAKNNP
jgi:hypothetical protein